MVSFVTFYLIVYCLLLQFEQTRDYAVLMFLFSPFLLGWMIYVMLKYGNHNGSELGDKEFGYQDKKPEELGVF